MSNHLCGCKTKKECVSPRYCKSLERGPFAKPPEAECPDCGYMGETHATYCKHRPAKRRIVGPDHDDYPDNSQLFPRWQNGGF